VLILFDGENISFDANLVIIINSTNIPPIIIINRIYEHQNLLSLWLVSSLVGLRTYQHPCIFGPFLVQRQTDLTKPSPMPVLTNLVSGELQIGRVGKVKTNTCCRR
jgi:hypothetical protein